MGPLPSVISYAMDLNFKAKSMFDSVSSVMDCGGQ